jgi:hypothetical protein
MMKRFALMLPLLAISACAVQEKRPPQLVADPSIVPAFPPAPVTLSAPVAPQILPQVRCLRETGWPSCPGPGSSTKLSTPTTAAPK